MKTNTKEAVIASFAADALALGVHWVYNTEDIVQKYGRLESMIKPELAPYHQSKQKGDFTHYGDQMLVLLESIIQSSGFDLNHFCSAWQHLFETYNGYMDHATKETLENFKSGTGPEKSGSVSMDLSGASRIAPLVLYYGEDVGAFVDTAGQQTMMTHRQPDVIQSADYFARTSVLVLNGEAPVEAMQESLKSIPESSKIKALIKAGLESSSQDTLGVIKKFGQMCSFEGALPATIHLIAKYEDNMKEALIENIMAGGDSSARGMLAGLVLGCYQGLETIPQQWLDDMAACKKIETLLEG